MNLRRLLLLCLLPILLAGCETVTPRDRSILQAHEVPGYIFNKMNDAEPLSLSDVMTLSACQVPSGLIIKYMDKSDSVYRLRKTDVDKLRSAGVDDQVISYMLSTAAPYGGGGPYGGPGAYAPPAPYGGYPYPYYPYDYYYGPYAGPVVVVGGGYHRWGGGGGWWR